MKVKNLTVMLLAVFVIAACAPAVEAEPTTGVKENNVAPEIVSDVEEDDPEIIAEASFINDIWPVIEEFALDAHGGEGGVFLENYDDILGYVIPGKPKESVLYKSLIGDEEHLMPPDGPLQMTLFNSSLIG
jgi:hypothetical protein